MGIRLFRSSAKGRPRTRALEPHWGGEPGLRDTFLNVEHTRLHPVDVDFNHTWQLAGIRFREREGRFTLSARWRCLRRVTCWLRCFAHLADGAGQHLGSMDHDLLGGEPQPAEWAPGDEGYETRYLELGPGSGREGCLALGPSGFEIQNRDASRSEARLWLGLYDTGTGGRLPVVSSTLPVGEGCTAVGLTPDTVPGSQVVFRAEPLRACRVAFEAGLELTGYAVTRSESSLWLRLRWRALGRDTEPLRFFGHGLTQTDAEAESLLSFDQELCLERRLEEREFEFDVFRTIEEGAAPPAFLRGGVCTSRGLERRAIRASSLAYNEQARCFFLPLT